MPGFKPSEDRPTLLFVAHSVSDFQLKLLLVYHSKILGLSMKYVRSSHHGSVETNLTSIHEDAGSIPGPAQRVGDLALL